MTASTDTSPETAEVRHNPSDRTAVPYPRIMYITEGYPPNVGGAQIQAHRVGRLLTSKFEITVLTGDQPGCTSREVLDGVQVHRIRLSSRGFALGAVATMMNLLFNGLRDSRPDIVQAFQLNGTTIAAAALAQLRRAPLIIKIANRNNFERTSGKLGRQKLDFMIRSAATFVGPSRACLDLALERGIPANKLHYLPNGVDTEFFAPARPETRRKVRTELGYAPDDFVFVWIGRLAPIKGLDRVLRVWPGVSAAQPDARLLLVGDGPEAGIARRLVDEFPSSVQWLPFKQDVRPFYRAADALLLTSHTEGLSNVLLEAMACGLPAVVSSAPENVEVGAGAHFLTVFDIRSDAALSEALITETDRRDSATARGQEARQRARDTYSLEATAAKWADLYRSILPART